MSPKQVWSQHLVEQQSSCFLNVMFYGEAFHGVGAQGVKVLILLAALFLGAHAVCFCALITILDLPDCELSRKLSL
jgi:hypothetical protein